MRDGIINFFANHEIKPAETLLFYYSGHGVTDEDGDLYLATSEIDVDSPYKRGFSFNELAKMAQRTIASRVIIILDCCYSGSVTLKKGGPDDAARLGRTAIDHGSNLLEGEGRCIFSSCQGLQEAYVFEEKNHSFYTYYLLQGLQSLDRKVFDQHGNITADSLSSYVHRKIVSLPKENRPNQTPVRKIISSGDITIIDKSQLAKLNELDNIVTKKNERMRSSHAIIHDELEEYSQRQLRYIREVTKQRSEDTKTFLFLEFIRDVFKGVNANHPHRIYPELEKYISSNKAVLIRGRVDAYLGNVIIEFESDLKKYRSNCESQLRKYTAILWNSKEKINYLCIATDGLEFVIFRPRSPLTKDFTGNSIELEVVDTFDIRMANARTVYKRLDRYFLYRTLTPPTAEDIVHDFGHESLILRDSMFLLEEAWKNVKSDSMTVYNEWSKYLSIVYGGTVKNEQLFLRHTYLATLAKLMVFSFYQENSIPTSHDVINRILMGDIFREWNIENFLIEDFFSWIIRNDAYSNGMQIALRILDGLEWYDLTKLNEDVMKELYQQLVDPTERHDLGEFYTPDWLAEIMIKEMVTDVNYRILDPACGTFLASAIRHKLSLMTEMKDSKKIDAIVHTVNGIDVHPLAVLISKANYLMAMGDVIKQKEGTLIIPVYMADSIVFPMPEPSVARYNSTEPQKLYHYRIDSQNELVLPKDLVESETLLRLLIYSCFDIL